MLIFLSLLKTNTLKVKNNTIIFSPLINVPYARIISLLEDPNSVSREYC